MNQRTAAVFCAGGPAPGFNAVIHGLTVVLTEAGWTVIGLRDGMKHVMEGKWITKQLRVEQTEPISGTGGSIIGVSRANPTKDAAKLQNVVRTLREHGVSALISIGGDDTAKTARAIARESQGSIRVIHVPKTIDNDLPLGEGLDTFGYRSAVHHAASIIRALQEDSDTTGDRQFVRIIMGRTAGWLAVGAAAETGSPVFIPEEFSGAGLKLQSLVDLVLGAVVKREAQVLSSADALWARRDAVHVVAEGVFEHFVDFESAVRAMFPAQGDLVDEHEHLRFSRIHLQALLDIMLANRMSELGLAKSLKKARGSISLIVDKLGFELRCVDPILADRIYADELGTHAGKLVLDGKSDVMVVPEPGGNYGSLAFDAMTAADGKTIVRRVPLTHAAYQSLLAKRLLPEDLSEGSPLRNALGAILGESGAARDALSAAAELGSRHRGH